MKIFLHLPLPGLRCLLKTWYGSFKYNFFRKELSRDKNKYISLNGFLADEKNEKAIFAMYRAIYLCAQGKSRKTFENQSTYGLSTSGDFHPTRHFTSDPMLRVPEPTF